MGTRRIRPVYGYVALVSLFGQGLLFTLVLTDWPVRITSVRYILFAALLLIGELMPIRVPRQGEEDEITTSTTFTYAILLSEGLLPAALAQVVASVVSDLFHRKPIWKAVFNASQYTVSLVGSSLVLRALTELPARSGEPPIIPSQLPAILVAGAVFCALNTILTSTALALAQRAAVAAYVGRDIRFQTWTDGILLAMSPIVLMAADWSLATIPLLALPLWAVYRGTRTSVENTRLVASLERSLAELHELNRLKDDFVSSVSHELRTPLTVMQGFVKTLLRTDASFPDAERRSFLEAVDRNSDRLRHLIERLLLMARLESDRQTLQVSEVSLNALCQGVADEVAESAPHHRYQLVAEEDVVVDTDETMLHQILVNLVENAAKYSPLGATVLIRVHRGTAEALVSVEDQGAGVPPADRERIFERFYRVDRSDTRTIGGAGLGLYIARRLANEIAGSVSLSRSDERGSVFVMSLPLRRPAPPPSANGHGDHAENAIASLATSGASGVPVPAAPEG